MREANKRPVAALNHNKAAFYMLETELLEALLDELADRDLAGGVRATVKKLRGKRLNEPRVPEGNYMATCPIATKSSCSNK